MAKRIKKMTASPNASPKKTEAERAGAEKEIVEQSKKLDYYLTEFSIELLAKKMNDGDFYVPHYQRNFTWEHERQSRFIESILMGLQIPFIFYWERIDGRLEIIDGSQRLRTLRDFMYDDFRLGELESLPASSHFKFSDFSVERQRKVKNRSIRGIVMNEHADEQARFDMFDRINTGSKIANKAEVRRGALSGPFMSLVIELAKSPKFVAIAPISDKLLKEREHEELVARFFAYSDGLQDYKDRPSEFIFKYAKQTNEAFRADPALEGQYRQRFEDVVDFVSRVFPAGFRRQVGGKATPRARFESIAIGSYQALVDEPGLIRRTPDVSSWVYSDEFSQITGSDGANAIGRLRDRMAYVRDKLKGS